MADLVAIGRVELFSSSWYPFVAGVGVGGDDGVWCVIAADRHRSIQ